MLRLNRAVLLLGGVLALCAKPVWAQENFDLGKTPAELYAADCAVCHKSPQGLAKSGTEAFLREHYTASREAAAAIVGYLRQVGGGELPARVAQPAESAGKQAGKHRKRSEANSDEPKSTKSKKPKHEASEQKASKHKRKTHEAEARKRKKAEADTDGPKIHKRKTNGSKSAASKKPKDVKSD